jgi:two-component system, NtrC family, sensor kinase
MNSLRKKITVGYSAIAALLVGLSLFSVLELRLIEDKVVAGEHVREFFDTALEIRRFEKNFFLYHQAADLAEHHGFVARAQSLLREHAALFEALDTHAHIGSLAASLDRYAGLMEIYARTDHDEALAADIRKAGKEIASAAEALAGAERTTLQASLDQHRQVLIGSVIAIGVLVILIGQLMSQRVGRPLKELEDKMEEVAAGHLAKLEMATEDREIASLSQAFNHVLQELELHQGQLVRAEKLAALGTLLSGVAHELNNPLSNIATSNQILAEEIESDDVAFKKDLIGQIDDETWRARRIVQSLLDYARNRDFRHETLSLARLVDDTLRLIRGQIPAQVAVTIAVPETLEVSGDRQRLQQLLLNLVGNALQAVTDGGEITVAARRTREPCRSGALVFGQCAADADTIELEVRDNGHGIAADVLPRIFDPFFTTKDVGKGSGLGLFIVFEIVEEHGGCIAVESEPGQGTAFYVRLPATSGEHHEH